MKKYQKFVATFLGISMLMSTLMACNNESSETSGGGNVQLDPQNPVVITFWHDYTGIVQNAFDDLVSDFNDTIGMERGIIIDAIGKGSVGNIEEAINASVRNEIGREELPNIFSSFADTAYVLKTMDLLVDLNDYFTYEQQSTYFAPFIDRGRIGRNNELFLFPVAKSPEILMLNNTDWIDFANEMGVTYQDLETKEGIARVAALYYEWSDGKALFGRDAFANLFVIGSKQLGVELFELSNANDEFGEINLNIDESIMRRIWDVYYVPAIRGYFTSYGRFRSDDLRVGEIISYVGSSASAAFFPEEVDINGVVRPIEALVLPVPMFEGGERIMALQGAGVAVVSATPEEQYASAVFIEWFTQTEQNVSFAAISGRLPVTIGAMNYELIYNTAKDLEIELIDVVYDAIRVALETVKSSTMYSSGSFAGAADARRVLYSHLRERSVSDRGLVLAQIDEQREAGEEITKAVKDSIIAEFNSDENFANWLSDFVEELNMAIEQ
ncbi:MAG: extracellular solute-binding protein [Oscillospiraceae bacterium]|nr:extracellular solute-binding protein [Oscillospiraceae bacterium]